MAPADALVSIARTRRPRQANEYVLVLAAMGVDSELHEDSGEVVVAVGAANAERASRELALYDEENRGWRRPEEMPLAVGESWLAVLAWVAILLVSQGLSWSRAFGLDWWSHGGGDAGAIRSGRLWRAVTALGLHVDTLHLLGNLFFGALFIALVGELLGTGLALLAVFATGALANVANSWINAPEFRFVGASTAVFAALGILGGHRWQRRKIVRSQRRTSWIPLLASAFLLAFLGSGGGNEMRAERIDVAGHACGFVVGGIFGALHARLGDTTRAGPRAQVGYGFAAFALLAGAWYLALAR